MPFSNAVIALTGVGREGQVGEVVAQAFADRGAELALLDVNADGVRARAAAVVARGGRARAYPCDLTDADAVRRVADDVAASAAAAGRTVRALVNVAGGFAMSGPVAESDVALLQRQLAINLTTAYCATRAFLPALRAAAASATNGGEGDGDASVVFFASAAALPGATGVAGMSAYVAAKTGVLALMRAVAEEERDRGVRANALAPTAIRTAENLRAAAAGAADETRYVSRESVADAVLFLCSTAARNVTGQVLKLE
jgi:3-oxoacyl-[acyl-carrier protein] reductase